jgi:hypothetical protein
MGKKFLSFLLPFVFIQAACDDTNKLLDISPLIESYFVSPSRNGATGADFLVIPESDQIDIDFGTVAVSDMAHRYLFIRNEGRGDLSLLRLEYIPGSSLKFNVACFFQDRFIAHCQQVDGYPISVEPGQDFLVEMTYAPTERGSEEANLLFTFNTLRHGSLGVKLHGNAFSTDCTVQVNPVSADFGSVVVGEFDTLDLNIENVGETNCVFNGVELTENSGSNEFQILAAPSPNTSFGSQEGLQVRLQYHPADLGSDSGELSISTSNNGNGEFQVPISGSGVPPGGQGPIARCSVSPTQASSFATLTWKGERSYDTNNRPLTDYIWSIVSFPGGSAATIDGTGPNRTTQTDQAGEYKAQLVVRNDLGQTSAPCIATSTVTPTEELWVQLYWSHDEDDMDLHMFPKGKTPRTIDDCYYADCKPSVVSPRPDWGSPGIGDDDPYLDLDDILGTGPENINIKSPAAGSYTVMVNDFPNSGQTYSGPNTVTVAIYINGIIRQTFQKAISGENEDWYVCDIDWPSGTITGYP